ncbi:MAG: N-acetylmuramoyl-L-alanine amidase [Candidatus Babeliales bacterium]
MVVRRTYVLLLSILIASTPVFPFSFFSHRQHSFTIMLDPAGDARHVGRTLGDNFERAVALQYAEQLKTTLEQRFSNLRVVLTRLPGEVEQPLQHANFANRLHADLYISIHFYQEHETKPHWYIYYFSYGDDFMLVSSSSLTLYTYDKAYLTHTKTTQRWAKRAQQIVNQEPYRNQYICDGPYKIPFKPLIGIQAPAIAYEIGLKNPEDWTHAIEVTAATIAPIITEYQAS